MMLRMLELKDAEGMLEWMHEPNVFRYFRFSCETNTMDNAIEFINKSREDFVRNINRHYAIVGEQDEYLGTISLKNIDMESLNAEYAISLRLCAQGKGVATKATKKILEIAFQEIGLNRIYLNVLSCNERAIKLYEKNGFVYEGEFRNHIVIRGEICSLRWYALLKEEYNKLR